MCDLEEVKNRDPCQRGRGLLEVGRGCQTRAKVFAGSGIHQFLKGFEIILK